MPHNDLLVINPPPFGSQICIFMTFLSLPFTHNPHPIRVSNMHPHDLLVITIHPSTLPHSMMKAGSLPSSNVLFHSLLFSSSSSGWMIAQRRLKPRKWRIFRFLADAKTFV